MAAVVNFARDFHVIIQLCSLSFFAKVISNETGTDTALTVTEVLQFSKAGTVCQHNVSENDKI